MAKWLAAGGAVLLVLLFLLWRDMRPGDPPTVMPRAKHTAPAVEAMSNPSAAPSPTATRLLAKTETAPVPVVQPGKLDPRSDEFFYKFDSEVPKALTRNAAQCYEGRHGQLHRNQKLSLRFKTKIVNGEVHVLDVTIKESTLNDPALETCFIQQVQRSSWRDDSLPDWEQDDELVLRPERGMKKFWKDNVDYVGAEAPPL